MPVPGNERRTAVKKAMNTVKASVTWDDVDVPAETMQVLHKIAADVGQAKPVSEALRPPAGRGPAGVVALFTGPNSANQATAAAAVANQTVRPLLRVELSKVVSKYIGETEKNLQRLFEQAQASHAILFFDEADALFGKRSEVKDSHDRYANIEINFLLQRLEAFQGLAILATNDAKRIDAAVKKICGYVVRFPHPPAK